MSFFHVAIVSRAKHYLSAAAVIHDEEGKISCILCVVCIQQIVDDVEARSIDLWFLSLLTPWCLEEPLWYDICSCNIVVTCGETGSEYIYSIYIYEMYNGWMVFFIDSFTPEDCCSCCCYSSSTAVCVSSLFSPNELFVHPVLFVCTAAPVCYCCCCSTIPPLSSTRCDWCTRWPFVVVRLLKKLIMLCARFFLRLLDVLLSAVSALTWCPPVGGGACILYWLLIIL